MSCVRQLLWKLMLTVLNSITSICCGFAFWCQLYNKSTTHPPQIEVTGFEQQQTTVIEQYTGPSMNYYMRTVSENTNSVAETSTRRRFLAPLFGSDLRTALNDKSDFITGSIARSAKRRYLSSKRAIVRYFAPQRRHVAPKGVKFV